MALNFLYKEMRTEWCKKGQAACRFALWRQPTSWFVGVIYSLCLFTEEGLGSSLELCPFKIRTLIPFMKLSEGHDPLMTKSPPNTITLRVRVQPRNPGAGGHECNIGYTRKRHTGDHSNVRPQENENTKCLRPCKGAGLTVRRDKIRTGASSADAFLTRRPNGPGAESTYGRVPFIQHPRTGAVSRGGSREDGTASGWEGTQTSLLGDGRAPGLDGGGGYTVNNLSSGHSRLVYFNVSHTSVF